MLARTIRPSGRHKRRGVVLILILAMLGLLALIGVTFATFSGQAQVGARNYAERMNQPDPDKVFDFALAQLIFDTDNPASALHGHSLVRDMYGNDSHNHGVLSYLPGSGNPLQVVSATQVTPGNPASNWIIQTNIPITGHPSLYGATFRRWTMRLDPGFNTSTGLYYSAQTFEVLVDTVTSGFHVFTVPAADTSFFPTNNPLLLPQQMQQPVSQTLNLTTFTLDGRFQRAFNGPGLSPISYQYPAGGFNYSAAMFGNFMFGQSVVDQLAILYGNPNYTRFSPDTVGMDEDYDAVDTENWFLGAQNSDNSINIPSFHRPGILNANDWVNSSSDTSISLAIKRAKILRPRAADHPAAGQATFPDLVPDTTGDPTTNPNWGKIKYDVDNDGDGVTDAVWLDLGFPPQRDTSGKLYKPLFAITVIGLNGRLPLNTAGNISGRQHFNTTTVNYPTQLIDDTGAPTLDHVSHYGHTPSEINPKYAFNGLPDATGVSGNGLFQLQKLLQGFVTSSNVATDGRWGEVEQLLLAHVSNGSVPYPRPGRSVNMGGSDDNLDSLDMSPHPTTATPAESGNLYDNAGAFLFPSERLRYNVTPFDPTGNGFLVGWKDTPTVIPGFSRGINVGAGFDNYGRFGHFLYYRPPGRPLSYPNTLHSWEAARFPVDSTTALANLPPTVAPLPPPNTTRDMWAGMPFNNVLAAALGMGQAGYSANLLTNPTFVGDIGAQVPPQAVPGGVVDSTAYYGLYPGAVVGSGGPTAYSSQNGAGSLMRDDPTEVNLYQPNQLDELFTYPDLEWLYRLQDIDGSSLQSRLSSLLPEAFAGTNSLARRRQFTLEPWDTNAFAWANDNPAGTYSAGNNANFSSSTSASYRALGLLTSTTPPLSARGRRINLNMPLPVSSLSNEPTRIKWINNAYHTFKAVLPPKAKDTPEELAAIGQFCANIIDFRDPDDTITIWVNPDVLQSQATATTYPRLYFTIPPTGFPVAPAGSLSLIQYGMEYPAVALNEAVAYSFKRITTPNTMTTAVAVDSRRLILELVNMNTKDRGLTGTGGTAADLGLTGWEVVVLPDNSAINRPDPITGQITFTAQALPAFKHFATAGTYFQRAYLTPPAAGVPQPLPAPIPAMTDTGPYSGVGADGYYVAGYRPINPDDETGEPTYDTTLEGNADDLLQPVTGQGQYVWVYLRRPSNPNDPTSALPGSAHVVVDSMRIPMSEAGGMFGSYNTTTQLYTTTTGTQHLYSTERLQPYRGGQAVPENLVGTAATPITNALVPRYAYGYSEQTKPCAKTNGTPMKGQFNKYTTGAAAGTATNPMTREINHSLGSKNHSNPAGGIDVDQNWSPLVFHDRDFVSVGELLLVPGCSPGLFTKQFVERGGPIYPANPTTAGTTFPFTQPPLTRPSNTTPYDYSNTQNNYASPPANFLSVGQYAGLPLNPSLSPGFLPMPTYLEPPVYPYLPDNFYYSAAPTVFPASTDLNGTNTGPGDPFKDIGGQNGAGWHRALEFFEVPSPMVGAIGSVADGENRDWMRQDLRPGQLNLNLIFDQSVYLGLIDDPRLDSFPTGLLYNFAPRVVSQVNANGYPTAWQSIPPTTITSASFSDFLKLRHGGSGFLFAFGGGPSGSGAAVNYPTVAGDPAVGSQPVAVERPYRSPSYPNINYTIMRPATIEPTPLFPVYPAAGSVTLTGPTAVGTPSFAQLKDDANPFTFTDGSLYWGDPGLKNPFLARYLQDTDATRSQYAQTPAEKAAMPVPIIRPTSVVQPPPTPPRRQFEIPDYAQLVAAGPLLAENGGSASELGDARVNATTTSQSLTNTPMDVFRPDDPAGLLPSVKLGIAPTDLRRHPLYRTELLQKMMNLTTVRTHQYAVWVTVGFFEVVTPGNPQLANMNPAAAVDQLGPEVGKAGGTNVRYRSFFIVDRTKATGFDPSDPGDFRSLILHRRRIE